MPEILRPRGTEAMLPHGGLPEVIPPYLQKLIAETGGPTGPLGLQFVAQPELERLHFAGVASDPLLEDLSETPEAPGLVYKYRAQLDESGRVKSFGRALWTITRNCAAYCRFCTRGREVGIPAGMEGARMGALSHTPHLSDGQIEKTLSFIRNEPGLNEIILSGGDPLTIRPEKFFSVLEKLRQLQNEDKLQVVRIGTRVPIHNPVAIKDCHYQAVAQLKNPYLMIHVNHPAELTPEALSVLYRFKKECGALVLSQTVLLRGVNDSVEILMTLFNKMAKEGIEPYYVYQNDPVYWARHFTIPIEEVRVLVKELRPRLSGLAARARFVIDTPGGYGKVPLPEGDAWRVDYSAGFRDFRGTRFSLTAEE